MDAVVDVFERRRSQLSPVTCRTTDRRGEATLDLDAAEDTDYLIRVAPLDNSVTEAFTLRVIAPDKPAQPPGQPLPAGGASGQVDRLANPDDAWSVQLTKGRTYRMNFVNPRRRGCPRAQLFSPSAAGFQARRSGRSRCDAQTVYTPPRSGRYMLYVSAPRASRAQLPYRLRAGLAGQDDTRARAGDRERRPGRRGARGRRTRRGSTSTASRSPAAATCRSAWTPRATSASSC